MKEIFPVESPFKRQLQRRKGQDGDSTENKDEKIAAEELSYDQSTAAAIFSPDTSSS